MANHGHGGGYGTPATTAATRATFACHTPATFHPCICAFHHCHNGSCVHSTLPFTAHLTLFMSDSRHINNSMDIPTKDVGVVHTRRLPHATPFPARNLLPRLPPAFLPTHLFLPLLLPPLPYPQLGLGTKSIYATRNFFAPYETSVHALISQNLTPCCQARPRPARHTYDYTRRAHTITRRGTEMPARREDADKLADAVNSNNGSRVAPRCQHQPGPLMCGSLPASEIPRGYLQ